MRPEQAFEDSVEGGLEPPAGNVPGRTAGWASHLIACVVRRLTRRKRVIVGSERGAQALGERLFRRWPVAESPGVAVLDARRIDGQLMEHLRKEAPDEVYFDLGAGLDEHLVTRVGAALLMDGVRVHLVLPQAGQPPVHAETVSIGTHAVISLRAIARGGLLARGLWRLLDVVGAALLLVLLSPLMAALALLVWWKMGRPVFHVQRRVGRAGQLFGLYKFRSMVAGAEDMLRRSPELYQRYVASNFKVPAEEDRRITPLGRLLRRTSLDELPQLWNVLRGDMSLVGPRAVVPEEVAEYGGYARMLLRIRPGLTGLWQVSGRSRIGYPERARMDLQYVGQKSLRKDLQILLRTLPAVMRQRGAL
jgi:lipopolysaccharide/colanic/teichoic acid biosynthesis glycosyltransferase